MDKQTLLEKINKATITSELKAELLSLVNSAPDVDKGLMDKISLAIEADAANLIEEMANSELEVETDKYDRQMRSVGQDVDKFTEELNQKADEVDLADSRKTIAKA
jgi:hypothetical protein